MLDLTKQEKDFMTFKHRKFTGNNCIEYDEQLDFATYKLEHPNATLEEFCKYFEGYIAGLIAAAGGVKMKVSAK